MQVQELLTDAKDAMTTKRVYGEPFDQNGTTIIPVATVAGGGGGGSGHDKNGSTGDGGGFAISGRPTGAFVITGGRVRWHPAIDVNRLIATLGNVMIIWLVTRRPRRCQVKAR